MINDESASIVKLGFKRILKAGKNADAVIRTSILQILILEARHYNDMINWQECQLTDPPILSNITNGKIIEAMNNEIIYNHQCLDRMYVLWLIDTSWFLLVKIKLLYLKFSNHYISKFYLLFTSCIII